MNADDTEQSVIDYLLEIRKICTESRKFIFPSMGGKLSIPLFSIDKSEEFSLDITRSVFVLEKTTFQNRGRKTLILLRLDINAAPHRNPDGKKLPGTHLHIYKEGFGDRFAYPLPNEFNKCTNSIEFLNVFMDYCHIVQKPKINTDLFT